MKKDDKIQRDRADSTRQSILDAAKNLFVEHGFAGTSMGKVARLAGVNHSLIFHHFQNKQGLWRAVKQSFVEHFDDSVLDPKPGQSFEDYIEHYVVNRLDFYQKNPGLLRMINWQRLEPNQEQLIGIPGSRFWEHMLSVVALFQERGEINQSLPTDFVIKFVLTTTANFSQGMLFSQESKLSNDKTKIAILIEVIIRALQP